MFKNTVIFILLVGCLAGGFYALSNFKMSFASLTGKKVKVSRWDITLPITATGEIRPARRVEIKAEASGEVIEIAKHPGEMVHEGDVIIRLLPDEEQRNVSRSREDLKVASANLETARLTLAQRKGPELVAAQARIDQLRAEVEYAKFRRDKIANLPSSLREDEEMVLLDTTYRGRQAQLQDAEAGLENAQITAGRAQQDLLKAEASHTIAASHLADAEKRLADTVIESPVNGVLADVRVQIGEVIQGGKSTVTGGTLLAIVHDISTMAVRADVDEADIGRVREIAPVWAKPGTDGSVPMPADPTAAKAAAGKTTNVTVEAFRDEVFEGVVERIYPEPRSMSNVVTYMVDVIIVGDNRTKLLSGMRAEVEFVAEHAANVVLCPNEALREGPNGHLGAYIPSQEAEGEPVFVPVSVGLDNGVHTEIRDGLTEGMQVYTQLPVKSEDRDRDKRKKRS